MAMVWDAYPGVGSELLAMLALADWSDDEGRCWPSMASIAKKTRLSEKQARRVVHSIIETGYLTVTDNPQGGATSRRYQIQVNRLTPPADGTPPMDGRAPAHVPNPSRGWEGTPPTGGSRTVIEPLLPVREGAQALPDQSAESKSRKAGITLQAFIQQCQAGSLKPIPDDDPIFDYAEKVGIQSEMLSIAWREFKSYWLPTQSRKKDWPGTFRNAVRQNRAGLWYLKEGEPARWTTAGEQARRAAA
ncbi:MAG TPA: helix-turn-helix domain-containing protein [Rhodocyclaceae bacterium]|nr:helix-turn-helix domain-containing protein [Rhodocyclaceae bacterium]